MHACGEGKSKKERGVTETQSETGTLTAPKQGGDEILEKIV